MHVAVVVSTILCTISHNKPDPLPMGPVSVHAEANAQHKGIVPFLERVTFEKPARSVDESTAAGPLTRIVYGYLPYWANDPAHIPWGQLTHLSHFSVEMNTNGSLGNDRGWTANGAALVEMGHAHGVQVTLTATLFGSSDIAILLGNATYRQNAIDNLLARVQLVGGDGVNIDFEFVPKSQKANFVTFMTDLTQAFHTAIPGSHVTLATPAIDWNGAYNYSELAENTDGMTIMGYGYHWKGGNPGPVAPIDSGDFWNGRNLRWTINDYLVWGKPENRHKIILGFPMYGNDWPTESTAVPGTATANGIARFYRSCQNYFAIQKIWDDISKTPYRVYTSNGQTRQLYCEDDASLLAKLDLVQEYDLGGLMWWAIGYVDADHSVWAGIDERFRDAPQQAAPPLALASAPSTITLGQTIVLDGSESFDPAGAALSYAWTAISGPAVSIEQANEVIAYADPAVVGTYIFRLTVNNGQDQAHVDLPVVVFEPDTGSGGDTGPHRGPGISVSPGEHEEIDESTLEPDPPSRLHAQLLEGKPAGCSATGAGSLGWIVLLGWRMRRRGVR